MRKRIPLICNLLVKDIEKYIWFEIQTPNIVGNSPVMWVVSFLGLAFCAVLQHQRSENVGAELVCPDSFGPSISLEQYF